MTLLAHHHPGLASRGNEEGPRRPPAFKIHQHGALRNAVGRAGVDGPAVQQAVGGLACVAHPSVMAGAVDFDVNWFSPHGAEFSMGERGCV